jgi:hypothetical protein
LKVRSYAPFLIVESKGDKLTGSSGFNNVTGCVILSIVQVMKYFFLNYIYPLLIFLRKWNKFQPLPKYRAFTYIYPLLMEVICSCRYIFGKNASSEKIQMTTPVFTQTSDDKLSDVSIQVVLPLNKDLNRYICPIFSVYFLFSFPPSLIYFIFKKL